jgi:two-component system, chemotaxis family, CheB/CheR fusion protein
MSDGEEPSVSNPDLDAKTSDSHCTIVGIGASAGGITALKNFFQHMPSDSGMAFVVIVHLAHDHHSNLAAILQASTSMPVREVTETLRVESDHVYVIPPGKYLEMLDGEIRLTERTEVRGVRVPIDMFLRTLADAYGRNAICVILSGSGSDGTLGLKRVKEAGGIAIAQAPEDAEYDSMPRSAIATDLVDLIFPASQIPEKLIALKRTAERLQRDGEKDSDEKIPSQDSVREITSMLRARTGHDFSSYKQPTVLRRIARRVQVHELEAINEYVDFLRGHPEEVEALLADLLITVTDFFRDKEVFEALQQNVVPKLFKGKTSADQVRVWVVGCATGEEAYSMAMLLREHADQLVDPPALQVFATDINEQAIATARAGRYNEAMTADVSPERLRQFFVKEGRFYHVKKEIREMVLFAPHNVTRDPPFSRIDLLSCRNLLIYLNRDMQERILEIFHFALHREGFLCLGTSESAESAATLFSVFDKKWRIYKNREASVPHPTFLIPGQGKWQMRFAAPPPLQRVQDSSFGELHFKLIELHGPPSVLVNEEGDIVHLSEHAGRYLRMAGGEPTNNLLKVIHPDLHIDCRAALLAARQSHQPSEARNLRVTLDGEPRSVNLIVRPAIEGGEAGQAYFLVLFEEQEGPSRFPELPPTTLAALAGDKVMETAVLHLEDELQQTKNRLRIIVEQYETSIEELKASNEELQAINEEMRSAGEELETGKEELQSVNEELITLNHELKNNVDELSRANSDLQNLISSTDIALIFLDPGLRIRRYTPQAQNLFNIIPTDIGRPIEHLRHKLDHEKLVADSAEALRTLRPSEREIRSTDDRWYIARVAPYRTVEDKIDGVVFTFVDITERRKTEHNLRQAHERFELAVDGSRDVIWDWDLATGEVYFSDRIYDLLSENGQRFTHGFTWPAWQALIHPEDRDRVVKETQRYLENRDKVYNVDYRVSGKEGAYRWVNSRGQAVWDPSGKPTRMAGSLTDISERKKLDDELIASDRRKDEFLAMLSHELRNPLAPMTGALELIKSANNRDIEQRALHVLERQVGQIVRMVDDLLDISRMAVGKLSLRITRADLATVVEFALETCRPMINAAGHRLTVSLPPEPLYLNADVARLAQVLANLLNNAIKYTPSGGEIRLSASREGDDAVIRVQDNGMGIAPNDLSRIFDIFTQGDTRSRPLGGLGIGLSLVKQLVEMHGGTVSALSGGLGKGSEFIVRVPLSANQDDQVTANEEAKIATAVPRRILVVDDNEHAAEILAKWLNLEGHSVTTALNGASAIEKALTFKPEVVCLDINLPDISGYDVAARLRRDLPDLLIIAISGWLQESESENAKEIINHYLLKPVDFKDLRAKIAGTRAPDG